MRLTFVPVAGLLLLLHSGSAFGQNKAILPYQNTQLPVDDRVEDLVSRMTLKEKITQLFNQADPIERLGIPAYNWWNCTTFSNLIEKLI